MLTLLRVTAIAQIIQGCLDLASAAMFTAIAVLQGSAEFQQTLERSPVSNVLPALFGIFAVVTLATGVLRIAAGILNWQFRGYVISIVAAASGLIGMVNCYCIPTSLTVLILTLVTLLNGQIREAFDRRAQGESARDVEQWLSVLGQAR